MSDLQDAIALSKETGIYSMGGLVIHYESANDGRNRYFFSPETMKYFKSRLSNFLVYNLAKREIYFVTSEKGPCDGVRLYTVRCYEVDTRRIETIGEFGQYETLIKAKRAMLRYRKGSESSSEARGYVIRESEGVCEQ